MLSYERVLGWALLASLLIHAAVLLLPDDLFHIDSATTSQSSADGASEPFAAIEWVVVPEGAEGEGVVGEAGPPEDAAREPESVPPRMPTVVRARPGGETPDPDPQTPAEATEGPRGNIQETLRPGFSDPRLYVDPKQLGVTGARKSDHQAYMEHLQSRIDAVNDSMGLAAARERAAKDWTFRDKDGDRWGISEEGLHLGGVTVPRALVPVPRATGDNQSLEEAREKQRQREEIQRQEAERERREKREESTRATRERKQAERERASGGGG